jgi:hypothetical protein
MSLYPVKIMGFTAVFCSESVSRTLSIAYEFVSYLKIGMRKDRLEYCRSIDMMHLSKLSHLIRSKGWKKSNAELNQNNILQVERAGFLAAYVEQESGPFGLMGIIVFRGNWVRAECDCFVCTRRALISSYCFLIV